MSERLLHFPLCHTGKIIVVLGLFSVKGGSGKIH